MRKSWLAAAAALMVLSACGGGGDGSTAAKSGGGEPAVAADHSAGFVGALEGTDAYVAVVADGDSAEVYACDGEAGIAARFTGAVDDPKSFTLTNDAGKKATATFADGAYSGELTLADGSTRKFTTEAAKGDAGLFHLVDPPADTSAGWVVLNDGSQRGSILFAGGGSLQIVAGPPIEGTRGPVKGVAQVGLNFTRAQP